MGHCWFRAITHLGRSISRTWWGCTTRTTTHESNRCGTSGNASQASRVRTDPITCPGATPIVLWRQQLSPCSLAIVLASALLNSGATVAAPSPERIKVHVSSPPVVRSLLFKYRDGITNRLGSDHLGFRVFHVAWQPNGILVVQLSPDKTNTWSEWPPSPVADKGYVAVSRIESNYWALINGTSYQWIDDGKLPKAAKPMQMVVYSVAEGMVSDVLNLGIRNSRIGFVRWMEGDRIEAENAYPQGKPITGQLQSNEKGVLGWKLDYDGFAYDVDFEFGSRKLDPLPTRIAVYGPGGRRSLNMSSEYVVLSFETNAIPLEIAGFRILERVAGNAPAHSVIYTNRSIMLASTNGMVEIGRLDDHPQTNRGRLLAVALVAVVAVGVPLLVWGIYRSKNA